MYHDEFKLPINMHEDEKTLTLIFPFFDHSFFSLQ